MPSRKSGLKHMRADARKGVRNASVRSSLKTDISKFNRLIREGDKDNARKLFRDIASAMDKAAKRNIIHKNTASRQKSRLSQKLA